MVSSTRASGIADTLRRFARHRGALAAAIFLLLLSVIVVNVLADLLYGFIDPRIRYG